MSLRIRRGQPADSATIAAFNQRMAWETEHKHLDPEVLGRGVARVFADPAKGFYVVAESAGEVLGQLMITYEWSDWRDGWIWWIQSVYVHEDYRRRGVFRKLFEQVVKEAKAAGDVVGIRLYVERENERAHLTYEMLGMGDAGYLVREMMIDEAD
jgi:GNAT superfamily N-acetyltransferase